MSFKKRAIIGAVFCISLVIMGNLFYKIVKGNTDINKHSCSNKPVMTISCNEKNKEVYKGSVFEININLDPGNTEFDAAHNPFILSNVYLNIADNNKYKLIGANIKNNNTGKFTDLDIDKKNIDIGPFQYSWDGINSSSEPKTINLKFKAMEVGNYILDENAIELNYERKGCNIIHKSSLSGKVDIEIKEVNYKIGEKIKAGSFKETTINSGKEFDLNYIIPAGSMIESIDGNSINERRVVYLIDKSILDKNGTSGETIRETLKKSLLDLKESEIDVKTSLVTYGENAQVVKINDKNIFSIDELISKIDEIKVENESSNLGDGIRVTQALINENKEFQNSVVLVGNPNPNYYTQKSDENDDFILDRSFKDGAYFNEESLAKDYANSIVNEIVINEDNNTNWYSINIDEKQEEENLIEDLLDKLEGNVFDQGEDYENLKKINRLASADLIIKGNLNVDAKNKSIKVIDESKEISIPFYKDKGNLVGKDVNANIKVKIEETGEYDLADPKNLSVTFTAENQTIRFNENDKIIWNIKVKSPYVVKLGLYNGRSNVGSNVELDNLNEISSSVLEEFSNVDLAIENYFSFGAIIKPIDGNIQNQGLVRKKKLNENLNLEYKVYSLSENGEFELALDDSLKAEKIYLIVCDQYINTNELNTSFEIGIQILDDFRSLKINVVDKAEYF